ncbi:hypothetical protein R950_002611 [Salmonella enterica subsp. enterica]|nr:hypothetical protein [Salmonella enterica subsp. enterica serovar Ituri]EDW2260617.1 hypothetical protein [Salmonella enterica subsp. enterica serovar Langford]EHC7797936.1 hypothetical protein [Salmonella enterica subsp. enterica serovar Isangi]EHD2000918.1 hypothetical protein [Salmonella enterica subsp. enterica serovar Isangi]EHD2010278.1 hypothetical protein [Salmonella enterica subsp. enterica serovar Isangi]
MAVQLIGSEPDDIVPKTFEAYLDAEKAEIVVCLPSYMDIPSLYRPNTFEHYQDADILDTEVGVLSASLRDLIDDYITNCMREDGGVGVLPLAIFFEAEAKRLRDFYETLDDVIADD